MDNKSNNGFHVSYPVLLAVVSIVVASITWGITSAASRRSDAASISADHNQIQTNTKVLSDEIKPAIQNLRDTKADKTDMDRVFTELSDIKTLLIQHMDKR